jgi:hypothetical protein
MTDTYEVPTDPADPVAATRELVVQIPCSFADPDDVDRRDRSADSANTAAARQPEHHRDLCAGVGPEAG